jgi:hypothetical protein
VNPVEIGHFSNSIGIGGRNQSESWSKVNGENEAGLVNLYEIWHSNLPKKEKKNAKRKVNLAKNQRNLTVTLGV